MPPERIGIVIMLFHLVYPEMSFLKTVYGAFDLAVILSVQESCFYARKL